MGVVFPTMRCGGVVGGDGGVPAERLDARVVVEAIDVPPDPHTLNLRVEIRLSAQ